MSPKEAVKKIQELKKLAEEYLKCDHSMCSLHEGIYEEVWAERILTIIDRGES